jgi:phospholipid transport system substrate-binding protein
MNGKRKGILAASALVFFSAVFPLTASAATPAGSRGPTKPAPAAKKPANTPTATTPTDQVRITVDNIVAILKNPTLKAESRKKDRRDQLRRAIFSRFDFTEMARRSMGSEWRNLSPKQQDEFTQLFTDLLERAYIDQIESYTNEKIVYGKEIVDQDYAEVQSKIVTGKGEDYSLNYKVRLVGKEWKVYDVVVENISLVNNYRSQFSRVIANQSYDELIRRMRDKQIQAPVDIKKPS